MPIFSAVQIGFLIWAVVGPVIAGGVACLAMREREAIVVAGAVRVAQGAAVITCNAQRQAIVETINATARRSVSEAWTSAAEVKATPAVPAEIAALCKTQASCRERGTP